MSPAIRTKVPAKKRELLAVYTNTSQLDEPVYRRFAELRPGNASTVLYWNDFGLARTRPDPELGVVPIFPAPPAGVDSFERLWIDSREKDVSTVVAEILAREPTLVVVNDVALKSKLSIAVACRQHGIETAFRSDKNQISGIGRGALGRKLERLVYGAMFDALCYVGELTRDYYEWRGEGLLFPYPCDSGKFRAPSPQQRRAARERFNLPEKATVLLSVIKFNEREGALETCELYTRVLARRPDAHVLLVGSGPLKVRMEEVAQEAGCADRFHFSGYVPYAELEACFFASDVFVQFARCEPWGVSVLDALAVGLAVLASDQVGSAVEVMGRTPGGRYITRWGDLEGASTKLCELLDCQDRERLFGAAHRLAVQTYSVEATARRLDDFLVGRA